MAAPKRAIAGNVGAKLSKKALVRLAVQMGASKAVVVSPRAVKTARWVAWKCRYGCGSYGSSLCCPPHSPAPRETRQLLDEFRQAVLFQCRTARTRRVAVSLERALFLAGCYRAFAMGGGPCDLCEACRLESGCRHPEQARPAMEACGIDVFATARRHGFAVEVLRTHRDRQHYFGMVLVR